MGECKETVHARVAFDSPTMQHSVRAARLLLSYGWQPEMDAGLASLNRTFKLQKLQKSARLFSSQAKFKARNTKRQLQGEFLAYSAVNRQNLQT